MSDPGSDRLTEAWSLWVRMVDDAVALARRSGAPSREVVELTRSTLTSVTATAEAAFRLLSAITTPTRAAGSPSLPRLVAGRIELEIELDRGLGGRRLWCPGLFEIGADDPVAPVDVTPTSGAAGTIVTVRFDPDGIGSPHGVRGEIRNEQNELVATFSDLIT